MLLEVETRLENVTILFLLEVDLDGKSLEFFKMVGVVGILEVWDIDGDLVGEENWSWDVFFNFFFLARLFFA